VIIITTAKAVVITKVTIARTIIETIIIVTVIVLKLIVVKSTRRITAIVIVAASLIS
jgi:hypothetical protein